MPLPENDDDLLEETEESPVELISSEDDSFVEKLGLHKPKGELNAIINNKKDDAFYKQQLKQLAKQSKQEEEHKKQLAKLEASTKEFESILENSKAAHRREIELLAQREKDEMYDLDNVYALGNERYFPQERPQTYLPQISIDNSADAEFRSKADIWNACLACDVGVIRRLLCDLEDKSRSCTLHCEADMKGSFLLVAYSTCVDIQMQALGLLNSYIQELADSEKLRTDVEAKEREKNGVSSFKRLKISSPWTPTARDFLAVWRAYGGRVDAVARFSTTPLSALALADDSCITEPNFVSNILNVMDCLYMALKLTPNRFPLNDRVAIFRSLVGMAIDPGLTVLHAEEKLSGAFSLLLKEQTSSEALRAFGEALLSPELIASPASRVRFLEELDTLPYFPPGARELRRRVAFSWLSAFLAQGPEYDSVPAGDAKGSEPIPNHECMLLDIVPGVGGLRDMLRRAKLENYISQEHQNRFAWLRHVVTLSALCLPLTQDVLLELPAFHSLLDTWDALGAALQGWNFSID
jgi:hypothetical protein